MEIRLNLNLNAAPIQKNGAIYVPLNVISDAMDMMVSWDSKTQTVTLKGKYEYDEKTENLILNTKNEVKIIGHVKNYDTGYIPQVNVEITPCGNEIVTVFQWTSGAMTICTQSDFYIKDGEELASSIGGDMHILPNTGYAIKENEVILSDGSKVWIFDDATGKLQKEDELAPFFPNEKNFIPVSCGTNYILGYHTKDGDGISALYIIDLIKNKAIRVNDLLPEGDEHLDEDKYYATPYDLMGATDFIKVVSESDNTIVFSYPCTSEVTNVAEHQITYQIGK